MKQLTCLLSKRATQPAVCPLSESVSNRFLIGFCSVSNRFLKQILRCSTRVATLLLVMLMSVNAWGALSSPSKTTFKSATSYSKTLPDDNTDVTWTASTAPSGAETSNDKRGLQFSGSVFSNSNTLTISSSTYSAKTITKIEVVWSRNNNAGATVSATVGGNTFGESDTNSSKTTNRKSTFEGSAMGDIVLSISSTATGNSFYLQSITVTYSSQTTLSFNLNNGSGTKPGDITSFPATLPSTDGFKRTGYRPNGWNTKNDGTGTHYNSGATGFSTSESVTLYVEWMPVYTVTYNGNSKTSGDVPVDSNSPYDKNSSVTVLGNTGNLERTGYTWSGWNTNNSGTGTDRVAGSSFQITSNTTLYAKWTANQTTVTLSAPDADISHETTQVTATYDKAMPTATMPQRTGYTFNGYFDAESAGTKYYNANGTSAKTWNKDVTEFTLHAQWTAKQYNITYKNQGNTSFTGNHETGYPQKHTYDQTTTLKTATRNGYIFGGWYENQDCSGSPVTEIGGQAKTEDFTLYAKWTARTTTVSFDKNAGDDEVQNMPTGTIVNTFDAALTTTGVTIPSRVGYTFVGWFDSSSKKYYGVTNEAISASVTKWDKTEENVTLSAHWEAIVYNITYRDENDKDFSGSMSGLKTTHTYDTPTDLGVGSKTGYTFKGWFTDAACTNLVSIIGARDYTDHITIYAKWEEIIPTSIVLDITDATIPWNADKEADNKIKITATVYPLDALQDVSWTAEGYAEIATVYAGSITGRSDGTAYITCKAKNHSDVKASVTVHVTHIPILTWKDANGTIVATTKATALNGGKVIMPTDAQTALAQSCSSDYALFYGWSATPISNPTETAPTLVTGTTDAPEDHTYYAIFRNKEPKAEGYKVTTTLTAGKTYIFGAVKANASATLANNTMFGAVAFTNTYNGTKGGTWGARIDLTPDANGFIAATNTDITDDNCKWSLESIDDGNHKFKRGTDYLYLGTSAGTTSGAQCGISTSGNCYIENVSSTCKDAFLLHPSSTSTNIMLYNTSSSGYRMYASRSYSASMAPYVRFYEYQAADASGIKYITQCCTPLDAPANGKATEITATSATISWNTVTNATGYQYKIGDGEWSTSSIATSANLTDLTAGTEYTVTLRANGTGTNCDEGTETSFTFTTLYTITATVNNEDFGIAQVSLDDNTWSDQVAAAPGTAIHVKATNNSGYSFSAWSVEEGGAGSFAAQTSTTTFTSGAANTTIKATFLANVKVLDHITITAPTKTDYLEGETFDPSGMTITAYWEDGTSSPLLINDVTIEPNGELTPNDTKVTISYTYDEVTRTAEQEITVTPVYTVKWYVNGNAVKTLEKVAKGTTYASLEKPDTPADEDLSTCEANKFMGWATALITKDGATEDDFNAIKLNEATATISNTCKEFHAVFAKEDVGDPEEKKIQTLQYDTWTYFGSTTDKSSQNYRLFHSGSYIESAAFDLSKLSKVIVYGGTFGGDSYNTLTIGDGTNTWKSVTVSGSSQTGTNTYTEGTPLSGTKKLRITSNSGFLSNSGVRISKVEIFTKEPAVAYSNFITTCKDVKGIAVQTAPDKTEYTEEETLDLTGLVVRVTYDDDSYLDITSGFTTVPANGAMLTNETEVTITYKEKTCDQAITITPLPRKTITATAPEGGTYTVKVGDGEAQTISAATEIKEVIAGRTITMTSTADDQHQLHSKPFVVKNASDEPVSVSKNGDNYSFTMPESNVTITAQYVQTYTITSATGLVGGTVGTDKAKTSQGSKVNVTVTPNPGYNVTKVFYVKDGESAETLINDGSFFMPASNVTVSAEFEAIKYTITLNDKGNITLKENLLYNAEVDLPALTPCYGYAFEGWTATEPTDGAWTTKPAIVAQVKVTADATFYAVYSQGSEPVATNNYQVISNMNDLESGTNYVIVAKESSDYYALNNGFDDYSYENASFGASWVEPSNGMIEEPEEELIWEVDGNSAEGYTFYNADASKYISVTSGDIGFVTSNPVKFTLASSNGKFSIFSNSLVQYQYFGYLSDWYDFETRTNAYWLYFYKQVYDNQKFYTAQPDCKTLDEIVIMQEPTKTIYKKGETFDKTGMVVYATFTDNTDADVTAYIEVDETTPLTMTDEKVTVSYTQDGVTATADQRVYVVDLASIAVKSGKDAYTVGKSFDLSKLVLTATYKNTAETKSVDEEVTSGFTVSPSGALQLTDDNVTITYNGKTVDYPITVSETQPFTVTFVAGDDEYEVTETGKSAGVFVPSVTNCGDYTFVGWSKDLIDGESSCDLVTITDGKYYPDEDVELYAVYKASSTTYNRVTSLSELDEAEKVVIYGVYNTQTLAYNSGMTHMSLPTETNKQISNPDSKMVWTLTKTNGQYQFSQGTVKVGVSSQPGYNNSTKVSNTSNNSKWYIGVYDANNDYFQIYQDYSDDRDYTYLEYYSGAWYAWTTDKNKTAEGLKTRLYIPGSVVYTVFPTCDVKIEKYDVLLNAGSGIVTEDTYTLLKGESMTLPTPTFSITDWSFYGWSETELKREKTTAPDKVDNPFTPTEDVYLYAIYSRPVGNGYVYKTYPSYLQRPSFSPEVGTYDEAKDVTITAGEGATIYYRKTTDELHHVMNSNYDATEDEALPYSSAIKTSTTTYIVAVAQYGDKFSDEEMYKIDFNYPDAPTFSAEDGSNIFKGGSVTITAPEGTLLRYQINSADVVELTTNTYTHTFNNVVENITLKAHSEKGGLKSEEVSATYHILPVPNKVTFHAGTGLIDGESTKEIYEDAAGEGLILPILDAPCTNGDSWKFYGWAKATIDATTSTPTILKEGDSDCSYTAQGLRFYPESDCELYAVYTKTTGIIELINEDFASATVGSATNLSDASTKWLGDVNFPEQYLSNIYQAGGTIKMGTGKACGYLTTKQLLVQAGTTLSISYDYQQYASGKDASIAIDEMNGTAETITIEGCATDGFVHKSTTLTTTIDNPTIRFMTTTHNNDLRCGLDNIVITIGTPVQNYATNPECCVHTISFNTDGGEEMEPIAIPCGTGNFVALPVAQKQNCNFIKWTLNSTDYEVGDIYEYACDNIDDVEFTAVFSDPITSITVQKDEIKYASELPYSYNGDLYVKDGGIFVADIALTVNNFVIEAGQGHAGQVKAATNLTIHGDAYMELELDPSDAASEGWYAFTVPFPVNALNGIYYGETKLTNEVGYAIMDYHGDIRAQGQYGWKKYRGILQPGVFYLITVGDTDYKTLRFHLNSANVPYTIASAVTQGDGTNNQCRTNISQFAAIEPTDAGWNGVGNKTLEYVSVNDNAKIADEVQVYDHAANAFNAYASSAVTFSVGKPFFVQASADDDFALLQDKHDAILAPRRMNNNVDAKIKVMFSNDTYTDNLFVSASEEALPEYEITRDLAKMSMNGTVTVPQIASVNYGTKLCAEYAPLMNNNAEFALNLYAPKAGTYTLSVERAQESATLYLMQNGAVIWNLSNADFDIDLTKGTNTEYSLLLLAAPKTTPTGWQEVKGAADATEKFIYREKLYLLRNGMLYDATGKKMK